MGRFVAVGTDSTGVYSVMTSPDGVHWAEESVNPFGTGEVGTSIAYNGLKWLALGGFGAASVITSTNGDSWSGISALDDAFGNSGCWFPAARLWVFGIQAGHPYIAVTSPDGVTWTGTASATMEVVSTVANNEVVVGLGGGFVAQTFIWSTDGVTWSSGVTTVGGFLFEGAWSESLGLFAVVGYTPTSGHRGVFTSPDGHTWSVALTFASSALSASIAWGGGVFVATFASGEVYRSTDGVTWALCSVTFRGGAYPTGVYFGNGTFVITTDTGDVYVSTDAGFFWDGPLATPFTGREINQMAYGIGVAPPTRQSPRDDALALGPVRQTVGVGSSSRQGSRRQGWSGTYS